MNSLVTSIFSRRIASMCAMYCSAISAMGMSKMFSLFLAISASSRSRGPSYCSILRFSSSIALKQQQHQPLIEVQYGGAQEFQRPEHNVVQRREQPRKQHNAEEEKARIILQPQIARRSLRRQQRAEDLRPSSGGSGTRLNSAKPMLTVANSVRNCINVVSRRGTSPINNAFISQFWS